MNPQRIIVGCWLAALGLIVWSQQKDEAGVFPPAYRVGGAAVTYTALLAFAAIPGAAALAVVFSLSWTLGLGWRTINAGAAPTGLAPAKATAAQRAPATPTTATAKAVS